MVTYLKNKETTILIKHHNQSSSIYDIYVTNEDDTLGNILQTHIANRYIDESSIINACGYKKSHPLEDFIVFTVILILIMIFSTKMMIKNLSQLFVYLKVLSMIFLIL